MKSNYSLVPVAPNWRGIADYIEVPLSDWDILQFPNENLFVRLHGSVRGQDVYIIHSHMRPVHRNIMEMLIAIDCLKRDSAGPHHRCRALHGLFPK